MNISFLLILLIILQLGVNYLIMSRGSALQKIVSRENLKCEAKYFSLLSNMFNAYENIRLFFIRKKAEKEHDMESKIFADSNTKMGKVNFVNISMALEVNEAVCNILTILLFYYLIRRGSNTIGGYFAFIAMKEAITGDINGFIKLKVNKKTFEVAYDQINEIIPVEKYLDESQKSDSDTDWTKKTQINIKDLNFTYTGDGKKYHLDYEFKENNCYLVLGDNGVGKSTLIRLLSGMLPIQDCLFINENCQWSDEERFGKIAILPQKISIFEEQLVHILISRDVTVDEQIAKQLKVQDIILNIQNHCIDESAISALSGGEKKKILLSLLFSLNHHVMILDEPFAELDQESKKVVAGYIDLYKENRIIIVITHEIPNELVDKESQVLYMCEIDGVVKLVGKELGDEISNKLKVNKMTGKM